MIGPINLNDTINNILSSNPSIFISGAEKLKESGNFNYL